MMDPNALREGEEAPPRGVRAMARLRWAILAAVAMLATSTVYSAAREQRTAEKAAHVTARYRCPMHPEITSDVPGECPICHMSLEPIPDELPAAPSGSAPPKGHPHGGMASPGTPTSTATVPTSEPPPGTSVIMLTFDRAQAIGVRTALVETVASGEPLRVAASVEAPSLAAAEVHVRTPGFIESVGLREIGAKVHAGQTLATVYSPEVYQAEQELLAVLDWKASAGGPPPLEDAKRRLELLAVPRATIDGIVATRTPVRALAVTSPIDGFVVRKSAVLGAYVGRETSLFDIVGLDRVYVVASVEPTTLPDLKLGASARFVTPSVPGRSYAATVDLVYPTIDPVTRQARVRFSLKNADLSLRPGQVGTAELTMTTSAALVVPLDAVVQTGRATYVFIVDTGGRYSARSVELGEERGDGVVVRGDVHPGDRVVSRATFLVDSDSRIRASLTRASGMKGAP